MSDLPHAGDDPVDDIARAAAAAIDAGETVDASALLLLMHRYAHEHDDAAGAALAAALGAIVGAVLDDGAADSIDADALLALAAAASIADDEEVGTAAIEAARAVARRWVRPAGAAVRMAEVEAVLRAGAAARDEALVSRAIDELERVLGQTYEPGCGISATGGDHAPDRFTDQVCAASALLEAYGITGRLPYSMLAEELMQIARSAPLRQPPLAASAAVRVWCRLAQLHADDEYGRRAVLAREADYVRDARRMLDELAPASRPVGWRDAPYGLALIEYRAVAPRES